MKYLNLWIPPIVLCAFLLAACSSTVMTETGNILDIFAPTPQEQCRTSGGQWKSITVYDAGGVPSTTYECIN